MGKNTAAELRKRAREMIQKAEQIEAEEMRRIGKLAMAEYRAGRLVGTPLGAKIMGGENGNTDETK